MVATMKLLLINICCMSLVCWALCFNDKSSSLPRIGVRGPWMVDTNGRVRVFHGINSVMKAFPWYDSNILNMTRHKLYKDWGFNVVRLGSMWTGAQPTEGAFNQSYISILQQIVGNLSNHGIHVILDMHQDVLSSAYHAYDGVPLWLIKKFPPSPHPYPWPLKNISQWADGYLTQAASEGFQHLYSNTSSALDYMTTFWKYMAKVFRNDSSVLGYEIINEPWAGDIFTDATLLLPGRAGKVNLMPMYDVINKGIRLVDSETLVFYEPVTWSVYMNGQYSGTGFTRVPGGMPFNNLSVLSYHYYCWLLTSGDSHNPYPTFERVVCDDLLLPDLFRAVREDVAETGGSLFLTEFGLCDPDGDQNSTDTIECDKIMELADDNIQSWTYWDSEFFDGDGNIKWNAVKSFARTYARAIAGVPHNMHYDVITAEFTLTYEHDSSIKAPTEIFVPLIRYPQGPKVEVSPGFEAHFDQSSSIVFITPTAYLGVTKTCNVKIT